MEMAGRGFSGSYRFGYQGSEKDNEVSGEGNSYTTEFRQLDPRLGRWFSVDPVFQPWQSPYTSMDNNPIGLNDVSGLGTGDGEVTVGKKKFNRTKLSGADLDKAKNATYSDMNVWGDNISRRAAKADGDSYYAKDTEGNYYLLTPIKQSNSTKNTNPIYNCLSCDLHANNPSSTTQVVKNLPLINLEAKSSVSSKAVPATNKSTLSQVMTWLDNMTVPAGITVFGEGTRFLGKDKGNSKGTFDVKQYKDQMAQADKLIKDKGVDIGSIPELDKLKKQLEDINHKIGKNKLEVKTKLSEQEAADLITQMIKISAEFLGKLETKTNTRISSSGYIYLTGVIIDHTSFGAGYVNQGGEEFKTDGKGDTLKLTYSDGTLVFPNEKIIITP